MITVPIYISSGAPIPCKTANPGFAGNNLFEGCLVADYPDDIIGHLDMIDDGAQVGLAKADIAAGNLFAHFLTENLYAAPGKFGGGAGTTWLVGSARDVANSLRKYRDLDIYHFVLFDTSRAPAIAGNGRSLRK